MVKEESSKKTCFVICPIGKENSEKRKNADRLFKFIIRPAVKNLGYEIPIRADHIPDPGTITRQIIEQLIDSDLVIADLSEGNPNVFYELAVRHVTKKHCIHMIRFDEEIPFDTSPNRAIRYNLDLEGVDDAKKSLEEQIKALIDGKSEVDNPIGNALTMKDLKSSGNSMQIMMADLSEEVRDLKREMMSFKSFCKWLTKNNPPKYDEDDFYVSTSRIPLITNTVLFRDPETSSKREILKAKTELKFLENVLKSKNIHPISNESTELINNQISGLKRWLEKAGVNEFKIHERE
jgi:hypothetical protein